MTEFKALNQAAYNGTQRPTTGISVARWTAMVKSLKREHPDRFKTEDK